MVHVAIEILRSSQLRKGNITFSHETTICLLLQLIYNNLMAVNTETEKKIQP